MQVSIVFGGSVIITLVCGGEGQDNEYYSPAAAETWQQNFATKQSLRNYSI